MIPMWLLEPTDVCRRRFRDYEKSRKRELKAVLVNLNTYFVALQGGTNPLQIKFGFIHPEGRGVVAIDQKGGGKSLAQTRLYVYADVDNQILYQLTLGDKKTRGEDIKFAHEFVGNLWKERQKSGQAQKQSGETDQERAV
jgi:hypothetical protein